MGAFDRVKLLVGSSNYQKLKKAKVLVFGIGGVGGYSVEALARSGIGSITFVDGDIVSESNLNRQIIATTDTVGQDKVSVMKARLNAINPDLDAKGIKLFYLPETAQEIDFNGFDYVVDAVDTVSAKIEIIKRAKEFGVPIISCMGTGGKTDPTKLQVGDVFDTSGCPLARVMRRELKKRGITRLKTVFSTETVTCSDEPDCQELKGKDRVSPPSMIFVPASAGLLIAREVAFDLIKGEL